MSLRVTMMLEQLPTLALFALTCVVDKPTVDPKISTDCKYIQIEVNSATPVGCMMASPPLLAKWVDEHPGWTIRKWRCIPIGHTQEI